MKRSSTHKKTSDLFTLGLEGRAEVWKGRDIGEILHTLMWIVMNVIVLHEASNTFYLPSLF